MRILLASQVRECVVFRAMLFFNVPRMCCACAEHPSYMCHRCHVRGSVLAMLIFSACVACELMDGTVTLPDARATRLSLCTCVCPACAMHVPDM